MLMMLVCCLVPAILLLGGTAFFKSIGYGWIGIGLVAVFLAIHFRTLLCSRHKHGPDDNKRDGSQDSVSQGKSCH
ncbi:MAG: hypothetical protein A3C12_02800 [Candidatus Sungbacteria bacterium RIFCSPHIGHO2_02_FULL_49_20]|uniref:Uncharacterized protein n=1 Tax=Candidatus Sungbacteria bacterium RIFCSPHIGHO2_02_FULL_49_20 TaxID=1802272 RepID=A0A1G2KUN9_9BACT|nr:MAG: hypothetical protein A3C12_02800 [Candidatus Sungbacteria bacterium RIFCSPHIGHO2_02_FULL_49_20]